MKILHIISQYSESTGSGCCLQNILRQARAAGHENFLVSGISEGVTPSSLDMIDAGQCRFVNFGEPPLIFPIPGMSDVMPCKSSRFGDLSDDQLNLYEEAWGTAIADALQTFQPDIIHSHHLWIVSAIARQLSTGVNIPQVISCHSTDLHQYQSHPQLRKRVETCREADRVFALSEEQKREIIKYFTIAEEKITIVGGGINTEIFYSHKEKPAPPPVQIVYSGKLSRARGVNWLLEAMTGFTPEEAHLHLAGSDTGEEAIQCLQRGKQLEKCGLVTVHGSLPQPELAKLMRQSHLFVLPAFQEDLPLVLLEALACGCRLACTDLPDCVELLGRAKSGLVELVALPDPASLAMPEKIDQELFQNWLYNTLRTLVDKIKQSPQLSVEEKLECQSIIARSSWHDVFTRINKVYMKLTNQTFEQITSPMHYKSISFQGIAGAYSDLACRTARPDLETVPCKSFEDAFHAVREKQADLAMIPVDNTIAGRVADVHHLLPESRLHIVGEHFQRISHCLVGLPGARLEEITDIHSHIHALPQCRNYIHDHNFTTHVAADTASGAANLKKSNDPTQAAIASELAAELYGLDILDRDIQDNNLNTTRFLILSRDNFVPMYEEKIRFLTTFLFEVRNIPAALYKALGGFATNNIQMVKLESYVDDHFNVARFYVDVEGHIESRSLNMALEELRFFAKNLTVMGTYPAHPFRISL
ncbi:MAG: prephenate dehydratase [Desulforhopalus sp.]|nr:prephenate dehydratase [Desulforhopalus sp.]